MDPVGFGVIGCSSIARRRFIPALRRSPHRLVAVASRSAERAAAFGAEFGADAVTGYEALLRRDDVEAVYVSVPTGLHRRWAEAALRAGKHVLVEKPLATSPEDAEAVFAAAGGLVVAENRMFAEHPQHAEVAALVAGGAIGELRVVTAGMAVPPLPPSDVRHRADLGGGALLDVGYYPLHAALLFDDFSAVAAVSRAGSGVDTEGTALLLAPSGATAQVVYGFRHGYRSFYELWGSRGRIVLERAFTPPEDFAPVLRLERQEGVELRTLPAADQFRLALERFARFVRGTADPAPHRERTLRGLALLARVRELGGQARLDYSAGASSASVAVRVAPGGPAGVHAEPSRV
ncbi:Gfo/Idh/MocA family protein [Actinokineospora bangkokensis]|uniref:Uncharacterized protein n=1 Tax=Actinokineospora bangkokensis TaxID=1193682 RepID=A0A1Q9LTH5_9PSEU|nr:Gfo/Idh/MocA family oxidoreductase [Actinokineospora bangkokensis]OLR95313.1 hypothetical protein BJP25_05970 [Actinokineospora bangkokensis]